MSSETSMLLRRARLASGISQFDLALRLGVSQRHVSFVELGRAGASRELITNWMVEVEAPLTMRNAALTHAGFVVRADGNDLGMTEQIRRACCELLLAHEPLPCIIFTNDWHMLAFNRSGAWLCSILMADYWENFIRSGERFDMIDALSADLGLLSKMVNASEAAAAFLSQLHSESWVNASIARRVATFEKSVRRRFGDPAAELLEQRPNPFMHMIFDTHLGPMSFFKVQTTLGMPGDVDGITLRGELWYAANPKTKTLLDEAASVFLADPSAETSTWL